MNAKWLSPAVLALVGLLSGLIAGPASFWLRADGLVSEAMLARRLAQLQKEQQQKAQGWDFRTIEIDNLTSELKDEKSRLRKETDLLDQRKARLDSEAEELAQIRAQIESMRRAMDERIVSISTDEVKNLRALSQTYAIMDPASVVAILREMDDSSAVKILSVMKPENRASIFEAMAAASASDPTLARRAAALSDKLRLMKSSPQPAGGQAVSAN